MYTFINYIKESAESTSDSKLNESTIAKIVKKKLPDLPYRMAMMIAKWYENEYINVSDIRKMSKEELLYDLISLLDATDERKERKALRNYLSTKFKEDQDLDEGFGKNLATGLLATSLALGAPAVALAKKPPVKITQAEKNIDQERLLAAIRKKESSDGKDKRDRYEPGVASDLRDRFDVLYKRTQNAIKKHGVKRVATSYGPYQVIAATAYDLGFTGEPEELRAQDLSKEYAEKYIKWLIKSTKTSNIRDVVSAYNAGLGGIGSNPKYINDVLGHYNRIKK